MPAEPAVPSPALLRPLRAYAGRPVLVAVSGGADSVALLRALLLAGARPTAAHLDHRLRPGSGEDAAFVERLAGTLGTPYLGGAADVGAVAARRGWTLEQAARTLRYSFLTRAARDAGTRTILTAHTRRDQAETVLWQLLRGEAVLSGIPAVRTGGRGHTLERPWLDVTRAGIEAFLHGLGQPWREDASNADTRFTRNWLRHEVLPLLQARQPGLEGALARLARFQAQDDAALQALAARLTPHAPRAGQPLGVLRRAARAELARLGQPVHAEHLADAAQALRDGQTRHLDLPTGAGLTVTGGQLTLDTAQDGPLPDFAAPPEWTLRRRLPGDRLSERAVRRRLSDVLTDLHVPRARRDRLWLLAEGAQVQWVGLDPPAAPLWAAGARARVDAPPPPWHTEMGEALRLARLAAAAGEVPVGAVVVRAGQVIGAAANDCRAAGDMTRHAELQAIRAAVRVAGAYLNGCTLVVTLEPCPMCLGAALEARMERVVYGASNPKMGALGGVHDLLAHHWGPSPEVVAGVRAGEAAALLRESFRALREGASRHDRGG